MPDMAVLIVSCDKYADIWQPFLTLFWKHWPDCPYPVYLGSNHTECSDGRVKSICVGDDTSWTGNLVRMLDAVHSPRILMLLDDFLLIRPVDSGRFAAMLAMAKDCDVGCLRLIPHLPPSRPLRDHPGLGEILRGEEYRVSTQAAIWDVRLLRALAWPDFSPWDFELIGSLISDRLPGTYWGVYSPVIDYRNGVLRGKWTPSGLSISRDAGEAVDLSARPALTPEEMTDASQEPSMKFRHILLRHLPAFFLRYVRLWRGPSHIQRFLAEKSLPNRGPDGFLPRSGSSDRSP